MARMTTSRLRAELAAYLSQCARHRNPSMSRQLLRAYCAGYRRELAARGWKLP